MPLDSVPITGRLLGENAGNNGGNNKVDQIDSKNGTIRLSLWIVLVVPCIVLVKLIVIVKVVWVDHTILESQAKADDQNEE